MLTIKWSLQKFSVSFRFISFTVFLSLSFFIRSHAQVVYTFAGNGIPGFNGDSISARSAQLNGVQGLCFDKSGNLIIAENEGARVRKINLANGLITTIAGTGVEGYSGDSGPAGIAQLNHPIKIAIDTGNDIFILDYANNVIRKIEAKTGTITTFAGSTQSGGFSGDGGLATNAKFYVPLDIALDKAGNLYIADFLNYRVRKINRSTGIISTIAGNGSGQYNGDNISATLAGMQPISVAVDSNNILYISDFNNYRIRKVNQQTGLITTIAGTGVQGENGDNGNANAAQLNSVVSLKLDKLQNIYLTDQQSNVIRKIDANSNIITRVAGSGEQGYNGDGFQANEAMFYSPQNCAISDSNDVYIADRGNNRVRIVDYSCYQITCQNVYTFIGNGSWSLSENWYNHLIPPSPLPKGSKIIIDPLENGECLLDNEQILNYGSHFVMKANKKCTITGNLIIK
jgi:hypothetical protein